VWELDPSARADMRVPARVFADGELIEQIASDQSLEQLQNVATLPGITGAALAMPDIHQGYGFPVGGVAATVPPDGVVSPGGVGYDINCGVRLLALPITRAELRGRAEKLVHEISRRVPVGAGHGGALRLEGRPSTGSCSTGQRRCSRSTRSAPRTTSGTPSPRDGSTAPIPARCPSGLVRAGRISSGRSAPATTSSSFSTSTGCSIRRLPKRSGSRSNR